MDLISYALAMAWKYYGKETFYHVMRAAAYIAGNNLIPDSQKINCIALAVVHDLLEDTEYQTDGRSSPHFNICLKLFTKAQGQDYIEYIKNIRSHADSHRLAYWVKLADIKDHLMQTETLTDRLEEKYIEAVPYLL